VCEYKSAYKSNLSKHMMTHTGEKPFHCKLCDYKAAQKGSLLHHMKKHSKETWFAAWGYVHGNVHLQKHVILNYFTRFYMYMMVERILHCYLWVWHTL